MSKYFDPKNDLVFKKIFGEHPHLLMSFLNALLKFEDGSVIVSLEYLKDELVPDNPLSKRSVVDVRCKDSNGRQFIVEMQMEWEEAFLERMLYNTAKIYGSQIKKGEKYVALQPVYGFAILNGTFDKETDEYYHSFIMQNPKNPNEKISGMNIVLIELPKFTPHSRDEKELAVLWLRFLKEVDEDTRSISPELTANREISEAIEICEEAAYSDGEKLVYDKYWDTISRERTLIYCKQAKGEAIGIAKGKAEGLVEGEAIGIVKGIAEGREEERRILALNLLNNGFSIEQTAELTALPIEAVMEIQLQK